MSRIVALGVTAALLVVLFCCPPPALAEQPKVMVCPITGEKCETGEAECDPPPPDLLAAPATPVHVVMPDIITAPPAPALPSIHELRPAILHYWSAPTRTIVLRI